MDYEIHSANSLVALWTDNSLKIINKSHCPLYLLNFSDLYSWLETRAIDSHRANSRLLKKALRLTQKDDINTVLFVNAVTITDNYWVKPVGSDLTYEDVKFTKNYFSSLALSGNINAFNNSSHLRNLHTPELTNIGSFEKCWKLINNRWYICKSATREEMFSELFIYHFGKNLNMNMAVYERKNNTVISEDFTNGASVNFEPANSFMGDNENYGDVYNKLTELCPQAVPDYIKMIFLDTIVSNPDRHTMNFGLIRDTQTGDLLSLAPVFDHNMALISRGYPKKASDKDLLISLFNDFIKSHTECKKYLPVVNADIIKKSIKDTKMRIRSNDIIDIVMSRYEKIDK